MTVLRPGEHPLAALRHAIERAVPELASGEDPIGAVVATLRADARLVLIVDQFEEVFAACRDEQERRRFLDAIVDLAHDPDSRVPVVLALRADFYGRCANHPALAGSSAPIRPWWGRCAATSCAARSSCPLVGRVCM